MSMRPRGAELVPAKPFADWLNARYQYWEKHAPPTGYSKNDDAGAVGRLCVELGWPMTESSARRLYRLRRQLMETTKGRHTRLGIQGTRVVGPTDWYTRSIVEEALFHAGVDFADVYPEIAAVEELALEPERWCPGCQSGVMPIDGHCPWCEWRVGPETGQVLLGRRLKAAV